MMENYSGQYALLAVAVPLIITLSVALLEDICLLRFAFPFQSYEVSFFRLL